MIEKTGANSVKEAQFFNSNVEYDAVTPEESHGLGSR